MPTPLKELYSIEFYDRFTSVAQQVIPGFDKKAFTRKIFDKDWEQKELKDRMKHTSRTLHVFMPADFESGAELIRELITALRQNGITRNSLEYMFLPDYIEHYGIRDFTTSMKAIEFTTSYTSCEFAVRPFFIQYGEAMMLQMHTWSTHADEHVRRLSSEGSRPRLPWAMKVPALIENPDPILHLLENLKTDSSEYVRRSVANNLNDISKDYPQKVIHTARQWKGLGKPTDALIKHGFRTLLKKGHPEVLAYYGLHTGHALQVTKVELESSEVQIGGNLSFSFQVKNTDKKEQILRLEYALDFVRMGGKSSRKVFKISERILAPGEQIFIRRNHSFRPITTRNYYPGKHTLNFILNGQIKNSITFMLSE